MNALPVLITITTALLAGCVAAQPIIPSTTSATTGRLSHVVAAAAPVRVSGMVRGVSFSFECSQLASSHLAEDSAVYGDEGPDVWVSCHDTKSGISANTHINAPESARSYRPIKSDERAGRVGILIQAAKSYPEIISTESSGNGSINITTWDVISHRIVGTSTMSWERDAAGQSGFVKIEYDLSVSRMGGGVAVTKGDDWLSVN